MFATMFLVFTMFVLFTKFLRSVLAVFVWRLSRSNWQNRPTFHSILMSSAGRWHRFCISPLCSRTRPAGPTQYRTRAAGRGGIHSGCIPLRPQWDTVPARAAHSVRSNRGGQITRNSDFLRRKHRNCCFNGISLIATTNTYFDSLMLKIFWISYQNYSCQCFINKKTNLSADSWRPLNRRTIFGAGRWDQAAPRVCSPPCVRLRNYRRQLSPPDEWNSLECNTLHFTLISRVELLPRNLDPNLCCRCLNILILKECPFLNMSLIQKSFYQVED